VLWASSLIALKVAFRAYAPMIVIWGRMVVGSLCFLLPPPRCARSASAVGICAIWC